MIKNTAKKLKIAYVSDAIYPYNKGGKEKRIFEITTRLAKSGHSVTIYCMKWWKGKEKKRVEHGVTLQAISPLYPLYSGHRRSIKQGILFALSCFSLLKENFDILDADHMPHLVLFPLKIVALLKRKKLYTTWNEVWGKKYWVEYIGLLGNIAYVIEWVSARMPDEIVAVSQHTKTKLIHDLKIKKPITVVSNGISFSEIEKVKPAKEKSDIIFAGRLLSHKNVDIVLKTVALLKKKNPLIQAIIVGNGPEKIKLQQLAKELQIEENIRFFNFLEDHAYLYALMKASRVFVFPSVREGFGIVALEANASGIPVVTANHKDNATKDLIRNGENGQTVKLNEREFSTVVANYLHAKKPGIIYSQIAQNYDWNSLSTEIERIYL